jgi:hypothetical protein
MTGYETYGKMAKPPATALKTIGGGRLKGMTDIRPQWRNEIMTETFGLCGIGWKYTIDRLWTEDGPNGEKMAFALVSLYVKDGDKWSDAIPGIGGSSIVDNESGGLHCDDEGFKMATTDALSVAMKMIGVAASIYMGEWNGSKYRDENPAPIAPPRAQAAPEADGLAVGYAKRMNAAKDRLTACMSMMMGGAPVFSETEKSTARNMLAVDEPVRTEKNAIYLESVASQWEKKLAEKLATA